MADYPVLDGAGATIVPGPVDTAWDRPAPHNYEADYPVQDGNGGDVVVQAATLGPNLVENPKFGGGVDWWFKVQATADAVPGDGAKVVSTSSSFGQLTRSFASLEVGDEVVVGATMRNGDGTKAQLAFWDGAAQTTVFDETDGVRKSDEATFTIKSGSAPQIKLNAIVTEVGQFAYFDDVYVRKVLS